AKLNIFSMNGAPIWEQLKIEEALLRADAENWCIINTGSPPAIVMGISGKQAELIDPVQLHKNRIPIIRRFSGGGTVVVDESTLFISFIFQKQDLKIDHCPQSLLHWTGKLYEPVFSPLEVRVRENDYVVQEKKVGGNAQYFTKTRLLHHTTFLWDYKQERMQLLQMPKKVPDYRQGRGHEEFVTTLKGHFSSMQEIKQRLFNELAKQFSVHERDASSIPEILTRPHRKALEIITS
ncbi:MAG TPA: lipoate--protein ligase family protein, partial [Chlamydiales bacterium]|nr:lipoate--protein ligase family protein [Chlamydiales bacterium]